LNENPDLARTQLQAAIDTWEMSLKATCGAIVPEKTVWWLVCFNWSGELYINDIVNERKVIKG
jgi:hypothetical protein